MGLSCQDNLTGIARARLFGGLSAAAAGPLASSMANAGALEILADAGGSVTCGFLAENVFYARFSRVLSARLGEAFAMRLATLLCDTDGLSCFVDLSQLETYDLQARAAFGRVLSDEDDRFVRFDVLSWSGETRPSLFEVLNDRVSITRDADTFEKRLFKAAPTARDKLSTRPESPYRSRLLRR